MPDSNARRRVPEPLINYLFLIYPFAWWQSVNVSKGRSLTDLPVHQCYYWPNGRNGATLDKGPGVIMAYNDQASVEFWGGLSQTGKYSERHFARQTAPRAGTDLIEPASDFTRYLRQNWRDRKAPESMVREMHRQLKQMHNMDYAPEPIDAAFMDWSEDPYGAGVHFWKIGQQSWDISQKITKPAADFPCYICGEAWSTNQTWAEGALETAEIVLQKHFRLPAPPWVASGGATVTAGAGRP